MAACHPQTMCGADLAHLQGFPNVTSLILNSCQVIISPSNDCQGCNLVPLSALHSSAPYTLFPDKCNTVIGVSRHMCFSAFPILHVSRFVSVSSQKLTSHDISQLLPSLPNLTELQVYWNLNITDDLLFSVSAYLPYLQRLNLRSVLTTSAPTH
jgi:hypothetical protein